MNFKLETSDVILNSYVTDMDSKPLNVVKNLKVVQTKKLKRKYGCTVIKNNDRKRKYALRFYLVNQDNKILNITSPYEKTADAIKAMKSLINMDNTSIYILPFKTVVTGGRFIAKGTIKNVPDTDTFVLTAEI